MRGRTLPLLNNTIRQSSSYVQVNIYDISIKGLRKKGIDIEQFLQHAGCRSVVMDVPFLVGNSWKCTKLTTERRTKSLDCCVSQSSPTFKTTGAKKNLASIDAPCSSSDIHAFEQVAAIEGFSQDHGSQVSSAVDILKSEDCSLLPECDSLDIEAICSEEQFSEYFRHVECTDIKEGCTANKPEVFYDCPEEFDEDDFIARDLDFSRMPISQSESSNEPVGSTSSLSRAGITSSYPSTSADMYTTVSATNGIREISNANYSDYVEFDTNDTNAETVEKQPTHSQKFNSASLRPLSTVLAQSLQCVMHEYSTTSDNSMQRDSCEISKSVNAQFSETEESDNDTAIESNLCEDVFVNSSFAHRSGRCGTDMKELKPFPHNAHIRTSSGADNNSNAERSPTHSRRKRARKSSAYSQESIDDECNKVQKTVSKMDENRNQKSTVSQLFHCQMPNCGRTLCYRKHYGKQRLVNHVRTHWKKRMKLCRLCGFKDITVNKIYHHHLKMHKNQKYPGATSTESKEDLNELLQLWNQCFPELPPIGIVKGVSSTRSTLNVEFY
ncbi:hypothetical protein RB195_005145 [Necator americanus]|uniref:C2H2-type domain-containing protein n=1 Tax=Necator americanus TaxID=51031 RepID=A0ABR1BQI5_NECAM